MTTRIALAADHGGFYLKEQMNEWLLSCGYQIIDLGAYKYDKDDDYPDFSKATAEAVINGKADRGIIICGSGVGACITANKVKGIRACVCHDTYTAGQGVEHDNMNMLCLGEKVIGIELAKKVVNCFLKAEYLAFERYNRRLQKIIDMESSN